MTRPKTRGQYINCATQLIKRFSKERNLPKGETAKPYDVVEWLLQRKPGIAKGTFRKNKASLIWKFTVENEDEGLRAVRRLKREPQTGALEKGRSPKFEKIKKLPPDDLNKLVNWLSRQKSSYADPLSNFLISSVLTGVRPEGWARAELVREEQRDGNIEYMLNLDNAKFDEPHIMGRIRILILKNFDNDSVGYIRNFIKWRKTKYNMYQVKWTHLRRSLDRLLYKANRCLWPKRKKHYKLSSARDQAEINFKSLCRPVSAAALLGQNTRDSTDHDCSNAHSVTPLLYGTKYACLPEPHPLDVERVKKHQADDKR